MQKEDFFQNSRGFKIYNYSILPVNENKQLITPKGLIFINVGYGDYCSAPHILTLANFFVEHGFAVFAHDHQSYGKSEGERWLISNFKDIVDDAIIFAETSMKPFKDANPNFKTFVLGESMGGAVSILEGLKKPNLFDGVILLAPMCKIADEIMPPSWQVPIFRFMASVAPKWAFVDNNILDNCFKDPKFVEEIRKDPLCYSGATLLGTARELYDTTMYIFNNIPSVAFPFLVLHGKADKVTDWKQSQLLYDKACSKDKTIKLYDGYYHAILDEPEPNPQVVLSDMISWLQSHL